MPKSSGVSGVVQYPLPLQQATRRTMMAPTVPFVEMEWGRSYCLARCFCGGVVAGAVYGCCGGDGSVHEDAVQTKTFFAVRTFLCGARVD